jgi:hypothetical protein
MIPEMDTRAFYRLNTSVITSVTNKKYASIIRVGLVAKKSRRVRLRVHTRVCTRVLRNNFKFPKAYNSKIQNFVFFRLKESCLLIRKI